MLIVPLFWSMYAATSVIVVMPSSPLMLFSAMLSSVMFSAVRYDCHYPESLRHP
ncbi:hypothetical protein BTHE_1872 [Bifidobacterium thermophilum]|nr:hypothetical protein BTHE_1872 [Bifidobacterium thermophilum]